eukprot:1363835-Amphidinium_carterae.2
MSGRASTCKTWSSIFTNELLSVIESGQKEPHCNNRDASSCVRELRLLMAGTAPHAHKEPHLSSGLLLLERPQLGAAHADLFPLWLVTARREERAKNKQAHESQQTDSKLEQKSHKDEASKAKPERDSQ